MAGTSPLPDHLRSAGKSARVGKTYSLGALLRVTCPIERANLGLSGGGGWGYHIEGEKGVVERGPGPKRQGPTGSRIHTRRGGCASGGRRSWGSGLRWSGTPGQYGVVSFLCHERSCKTCQAPHVRRGLPRGSPAPGCAKSLDPSRRPPPDLRCAPNRLLDQSKPTQTKRVPDST